MSNSLPNRRFLYRGDSDRKNERKLRETISSGVLLTNLSNGGNGNEKLRVATYNWSNYLFSSGIYDG